MKMVKKFDQTTIKCEDYGLHRRLSKVIEEEKLMAKYRLLSENSSHLAQVRQF
jgi:hypothetical protein